MKLRERVVLLRAKVKRLEEEARRLRRSTGEAVLQAAELRRLIGVDMLAEIKKAYAERDTARADADGMRAEVAGLLAERERFARDLAEASEMRDYYAGGGRTHDIY